MLPSQDGSSCSLRGRCCSGLGPCRRPHAVDALPTPASSTTSVNTTGALDGGAGSRSDIRRRSSSARLVIGRIRLERYRQTAERADLEDARDRVAQPRCPRARLARTRRAAGRARGNAVSRRSVRRRRRDARDGAGFVRAARSRRARARARLVGVRARSLRPAAAASRIAAPCTSGSCDRMEDESGRIASSHRGLLLARRRDTRCGGSRSSLGGGDLRRGCARRSPAIAAPRFAPDLDRLVTPGAHPRTRGAAGHDATDARRMADDDERVGGSFKRAGPGAK